MAKNEDSGSPGWSASFFMQTTEDVARAVAAAAAAATTVPSPRPSVIFSSKDDNSDSRLQKLQNQFSRVLKGFSHPPEVKRVTYNPEVLTSQKRQWASFQLQSLDHRPLKEPSRIFESMVVVGLHPNCDIQALQKQYFCRKSEGSGKFQSAINGHHQSRVEPSLEPQVLFVYPPEKQLPLKYKDLLSFCFPGGVEVGWIRDG
ncbi:DENN (AEX-3) domain-containing protein [Actinidia rufa]|uniref:DENN (AEX-3) domain-containing protein n=1 Tax=Actinidia rufa TaxID=165716 RepID=A0A7J0FII3_9ERIC|nr:DENN (AEX-3) domain-containing protein [Actinidia rufa]